MDININININNDDSKKNNENSSARNKRGFGVTLNSQTPDFQKAGETLIKAGNNIGNKDANVTSNYFIEAGNVLGDDYGKYIVWGLTYTVKEAFIDFANAWKNNKDIDIYLVGIDDSFVYPTNDAIGQLFYDASAAYKNSKDISPFIIKAGNLLKTNPYVNIVSKNITSENNQDPNYQKAGKALIQAAQYTGITYGGLIYENAILQVVSNFRAAGDALGGVFVKQFYKLARSWEDSSYKNDFCNIVASFRTEGKNDVADAFEKVLKDYNDKKDISPAIQAAGEALQKY